MKVIFRNTKLEFETAPQKEYAEFENEGYLNVLSGSAKNMYGLSGASGWATLPIPIENFTKIVIEQLTLSDQGWIVAFFESKPFTDFTEEKTTINAGIVREFMPDISMLGVGSAQNIEISLAAKKLAGATYVMFSHYGTNPAPSVYLQ